MKCIKVKEVRTSKEMDDFVGFAADLGRIAGIINHRANKKWHTRNVRFGFIEFVDEPEVSAALLHAVEEWGKTRGMDCILGPMGIFDFDKEGMLVEDFDQIGSMITIYNYPYYPKHMEALGYEKAVDWLQVRVEVPREIPPKYARVAKLSKEMFGLRVRKLTNADISKRGYGEKVFHLLNQAYAPLFGYTELSDKQIDLYIRRYLPLVNKQLLPVIENEQGELIGAAVTMGSFVESFAKIQRQVAPVRLVPFVARADVETGRDGRNVVGGRAAGLSRIRGKRFVF